MAKEHSIFADGHGDRGGKAYFGNGQDIVKQARSTQI